MKAANEANLFLPMPPSGGKSKKSTKPRMCSRDAEFGRPDNSARTTASAFQPYFDCSQPTKSVCLGIQPDGTRSSEARSLELRSSGLTGEFESKPPRPKSSKKSVRFSSENLFYEDKRDLRHKQIEEERKEKHQPDLQPDLYPALQPGLQPDLQPDLYPALQPGLQPGLQPDLQPDLYPALQPGLQPGLQPDLQPDLYPALRPGLQSDSQPAAQPEYQSDLLPDYQPATQPDYPPAQQPATQPDYQSDFLLDSQQAAPPACEAHKGESANEDSASIPAIAEARIQDKKERSGESGKVCIYTTFDKLGTSTDTVDTYRTAFRQHCEKIEPNARAAEGYAFVFVYSPKLTLLNLMCITGSALDVECWAILPGHKLSQNNSSEVTIENSKNSFVEGYLVLLKNDQVEKLIDKVMKTNKSEHIRISNCPVLMLKSEEINVSYWDLCLPAIIINFRKK